MPLRSSSRRGFPVPVELLEDRRLLSAVASATALVTSANPAVFGQSVTLSATVTAKTGGGSPGGNVTFKDGNTVLGTVAVNTTTHHATLVTSKLGVATHNLTAMYAGTAAFTASTSPIVHETVNADATTTTLTASTLSPLLGQSVSLTATPTAVAPGAGLPTGTVTFKQGSTVIGSAAIGPLGHATIQIYTLFSGSHTITAVYSGSTSFKSSTSASKTVVVKQPTYTTSGDGLKKAAIAAGSGPGAVNGQYIKVDYTGYLTNGTKFDSSLNAGRTPFDFQLGAGTVIQGWEEGMLGAQVGQTLDLDIPPALGYGSMANGSIPANSTLIFIIRVIAFDTAPKLVITGKNGVAVTTNEAATATNGTNFGSVKVGSSSATLTLTISNTGNGPLDPTTNPPITISGTNPGDFVITQPVVNASNQVIFTITFKPKTTGTRTAKITIHTNDPTAPSFSFTIIGVGI
jgi:hypothetical protein